MAYDREERIRARAHAIWESEGRPHGRDAANWARATADVDAEAASSAGGDPSGRSLGSAAQSDLLPDDAGMGGGRAGSLVDTGPALGLVAGGAGAGGTGGGSAGLGNLSLGQDVGHGEGEGPGEAGGMSSIGTGTADAGPAEPTPPKATDGAPASKRPRARKA